MFWILTICLTIGLSNAYIPMGECNVPAGARENCGYPGISEIECNARQCCFDSNVFNVPWCFKPASIDGHSPTINIKGLHPCKRGWRGNICVATLEQHTLYMLLGDKLLSLLKQLPVFLHSWLGTNPWNIEKNRLDKRMEYKTYLVLAIALCLGSVCPQKCSRPPYACQCLMEVNERERCESSEGITAEQCTANGCCFDASMPGVPWCFKPSGSRVSLNYARKMIPPQERKDCGYQGISPKRCKRFGCCFDREASGAPTCFHPPVNDASQHCVMDRSARQECGYPGITAEECQARGCCFNSYVISTRWCFHPLSDTVPARICGMAPNRRVPCGTPGISADECMEKGCCYEHYQYAKTVPWCFKPYEKQGNYSLSECRCDVDPQKRFNCGSPGITPQQCRNSGCCFSSAVPEVPWCFKPAPPKYKKVCPTDVKLRKNCGYPGIPADECAKRGCCFESKPPGVPWCFFHISVEEEC
ncbi:trefoil factor 2 [Candoia aspera]|uniref:trefoil factor 2 n=1 Tax=Candoia aspera TaxID=51853 RepID=UPI002FD86667